MRVSLIGGTGFVGSHLVPALLEANHTTRLLVRPDCEAALPSGANCEIARGDIGDPAAIAKCVEGADAVIYLIGILREYPSRGVTFEELQFRGVERTIDAAVKAGADRLLLMSANGVKPDGTAYQQTKYRAEEAVKASELGWTIFRPSVIFGEPKGRMEFCTQLRQDIIDSPFPAPLFYDGLFPFDAGRFELSPVAVEDIAQAFVRSLDRPETLGTTLRLCGPDQRSWKQILETIAAAVGKKKLMIPAPAFGIKAAAALFDGQTWFPITRDQIVMLLEGNLCDDAGAFRLLNIEPRRFDVESLAYLRGQ